MTFSNYLLLKKRVVGLIDTILLGKITEREGSLILIREHSKGDINDRLDIDNMPTTLVCKIDDEIQMGITEQQQLRKMVSC